MSAGGENGDVPGRLGAVDSLRGLALAGMIVFHAGWDLRSLGLVEALPTGWPLFGHGVAALFLGLSGFSLALADRRGVTLRQVAERLARLALAAAAVSVASWLFAPDEWIRFGILHCLVIGNALALPLRRAPATLTSVLAVLLLVAPLLWPVQIGPPTLFWLGLATGSVPPTLDFRPLVPWMGFILAGLALAQASRPLALPLAVLGGKLGRGLRWAGRHSLMVYLLHQAVLYPPIWLLADLTGAAPQAWTESFVRQCRMDCEAEGAERATCAGTCACVGASLAANPRTAERADRPALAAAARLCLAQPAR